MSTIEGLNSTIERYYLRVSTQRYVESGEYNSLSQMIGESDFENINDFIKYELIIKIAYSWQENIYDIGKWRYDPMFRLMYNTIIGNPSLITHMIQIINTARRDTEICEELPEYSPLTVMRHYVYYHALSLDSTFFERHIEEELNRPLDDEIFVRRDPDASDSDDDDDINSSDSDDDDIPYPVEDSETKPTRIPPPA